MRSDVRFVNRGLFLIAMLSVALACGCMRHGPVSPEVPADAAAAPNAQPDRPPADAGEADRPPAQSGAADLLAAAGAAADRDHLLGWYAIKGDRERLLFVLKRGGTYYSVCRGFEAPFKPSPAGLEWAFEPSSMKGTTIGFDEEAGGYYLAVFDSQAANFTEERYGVGAKEPLTRIDQPAWVLDPTAPAPRTNDDFLGWYQPIWIPQMRWELRKEAEGVVVVYGEYDTRSGRIPEQPHVVTPLADELGFTEFERNNRDVALKYDAASKRYEMAVRSAGLRMPVARIAAPSTTAPAASPPRVRVGIPCWH